MAQLTSLRVVSDRSIHPPLMRMSAQQSTNASSITTSPTCRGLRKEKGVQPVSSKVSEEKSLRVGRHVPGVVVKGREVLLHLLQSAPDLLPICDRTARLGVQSHASHSKEKRKVRDARSGHSRMSLWIGFEKLRLSDSVPSLRRNPAFEKSFHVSVSRFSW